MKTHTGDNLQRETGQGESPPDKSFELVEKSSREAREELGLAW